MGWSRSRRVILLRRRLRGLSSWPIRPVKGGQLQLGLVEIGTDRQLWEYGALVTSLDAEIITLGQLYRDRGDCRTPSMSSRTSGGGVASRPTIWRAAS